MTNIAQSVSAEAPPAVFLDPQRCQFAFADGRHCRMPALCAAHARGQASKEAGLAAEPAEPIDLDPRSGEFTTATEINRALGKAFLLLAQGRIPRRNVVAFGYIAQLMLQTLPRVREEIIAVCGQENWQKNLESAVYDEEEDEEETNEPGVNDSESSAQSVAAEEDGQHEAEKESDPRSGSEGAVGAAPFVF